MSSETPVPAAGPWPVLDLYERRVLGVLVEKAKTTPDVYPLSVNALLSGCNQKSNRDPLLSLTDQDVEDALVRCQKKGLAIKITGGRVIRWRHSLYEAWHVDKVDLAILAELLLRGPQTEGELRTRASRMEPLDDLDALRNVLKPLAERKLVVYLTAEERRGAMLSHGFHDPKELEQLHKRHAAEAVTAPAVSSAPALEREAPPSVPPPQLAVLEESLADARAEISSLKELVNRLQGDLASLHDEVRSLKQALGV
jgi:uncharacterized protein YceH (UPF0502 family)